MNPGRGLDALVAEKVMGLTVQHCAGYVAPNGVDTTFIQLGYVKHASEMQTTYVPYYSTDISAAWEVVEKLAPKEDEFRITRYHLQEWSCVFEFFNQSAVSADTAPMAICLAALKAVGHE